jgi:hypothetical protein
MLPLLSQKSTIFCSTLILQISDLPRSQRYLLGDRLELVAFDVLELLLEACYSQPKLPLLKTANIKLEKIRAKIRIPPPSFLVALSILIPLLEYA